MRVKMRPWIHHRHRRRRCGEENAPVSGLVEIPQSPGTPGVIFPSIWLFLSACSSTQVKYFAIIIHLIISTILTRFITEVINCPATTGVRKRNLATKAVSYKCHFKERNHSSFQKSPLQNILKLLFRRHISLLQRKTTPLQIPSHMGRRYAIWRKSRIGSALVRVGQPICSEFSAMEANLFHRSRLKHYSKIRLLTLRRVKFDGISPRTPELEHLPQTAFIRCV